MPKYVLDTDTCIYWLKGNKNIEKRILKAGMENILISVITQCELFYGAFKSAKRKRNLKVVRDLMRKIKILHTTEEVPLIYGKTKAELERKGQSLDDADLLIASITLANGYILITNNIDHFQRIPDLKIENWSK